MIIQSIILRILLIWYSINCLVLIYLIHRKIILMKLFMMMTFKMKILNLFVLRKWFFLTLIFPIICMNHLFKIQKTIIKELFWSILIFKHAIIIVILVFKSLSQFFIPTMMKFPLEIISVKYSHSHKRMQTMSLHL